MHPSRQKSAVKSREVAGGVLLHDDERCAFLRLSDLHVFPLPHGADTSDEMLTHLAYQPLGVPPLVLPLRMVGSLLPIIPSGKPYLLQSKPRLGRLTLHVSNACNLACEYCYVQQGNPGEIEELMPPRTVRAVLEHVLEKYGEIGTLHFFGGEPFMNPMAMDLAGEILLEATNKRKIAQMPQMVVTTNGTWIDPAGLAVMKRWKMTVMVSWDGPKEIHDRSRPTKSGLGSYELVAASIERLQRHNIPFFIECTYNGYHQRDGVSLADLMEFFYAHTGKAMMQITPAFTPLPGACRFPLSGGALDFAQLVEQYRDATRLSMHNIQRGEGPILDLAWRAARRLATSNPSDGRCPAFTSQLAVATDGTAYPCFMLVGDAEYAMGNLASEECSYESILEAEARYRRDLLEMPRTWHSHLLEPCVAGEALLTGDLGGQTFAPVAQAIAEECVLSVATWPDAEIGSWSAAGGFQAAIV